MNMTGREIRLLRQRLGWSLAEMARQMGCSTALVSDWESGVSSPDADALNQLLYLSNYVESYSQQIAQKPIAEKEIESRRVSQLTHRDLLKDN
ncbi:MAG: helix-turn-helix domain-containing protein [Bdellovibrionales bacterium]